MKEDIFSLVLKDSNLQAKLVLATGKSFSTIWRWANKKDERLTTYKAALLINEHMDGDSDYFLELLKNSNN